MAKAKVELAKAKKEVKEAIRKCKASNVFTIEKARAMVDFCKSEKFFAKCQEFSQESFEEGFKMGELECQTLILDHHPGLKLDF